MTDLSEQLLADLQRAHREAAEFAGNEPLGVRVVERVPDQREYLVAFEGPAFLCLDPDLGAEARAEVVREAASASILWERVESEVDGSRLRGLAAAAGRVLAVGMPDDEVAGALQLVAQRALDLADWRDRPERAVAMLTEADVAIQRQEALYRAYGAFVKRSEHLVERQDQLADDLVDSLRAFEESAGTAGAGRRLADALAEALPACHEQAEQIVSGHLTPLD